MVGRLLALGALLLASSTLAASVAVHDPSIVIAYVDASGNSHPENDAAKTRSKRYYVFGTQLGAAYSQDMIDWTPFTPSFAVNGAVTSDYTKAFQAAALWSGHATSDQVKGNLWAPDILYNRVLKKWTLYCSINGDDWKSSVVMHTADRIEGPYTYAGTVVYSGMDKQTTGAGNDDYRKVTGSSTVAARYLDANGQWTGTYGTSTIDPAVTYDEQGRLWMVYGSWSGGIFLLKLDERTGLRDYGYDYGFGTGPVSNGTALRYDPYMGIHLGGGYYVSGEGPYLRYLKDPAGTGYYYLFVSMGFYSPEGGYTMRVFRSATIDGEYKDVTGDNAVFSKYVFNYGSNLQYGFPIMQNYRWSWWSKGEVAQGHNSVLRDEDSNGYLVYHRKFDDGTAFHNVETHQLVFNRQGWPLAAPFEYRQGYGLPAKALRIEEIVGAYGTITHDAVDYAKLASNQEAEMRLHADGTVSGAYTGTWSYELAAGRHDLTLVTTAGTFSGTVLEQLMNDHSARTVAFTAMNPANEKALWGYRKPKTLQSSTRDLSAQPKTIGSADWSLAWNSYDQFETLSASGDFAAEFVFKQSSRGANGWDNWALILGNGAEMWHLRGDAHSLSTLTGTTVKHKTDWNGAIDFKKAYAGKTVRLVVHKTGSAIEVLAYADGTLVATATATNCPAGNYTVQLGGEAVSLQLSKAVASKVVERERVGTVTDFGTYTTGFNTAFSSARTVTGDFRIRYRFVNHRSPRSKDNWDNYMVRSTYGGKATLLRADAYALDVTGQMSYTYDWTWDKFLELMSGAEVDLTIARKGNAVQYEAKVTARTGEVYSYAATNTATTTLPISFDLSTEEGMIDLLETDTIAGGGTSVPVGVAASSRPRTGTRIHAEHTALVIEAEGAGTVRIRTPDGRIVRTVEHEAGTRRVEGLRPGLYLVGRESFAIP